MDTTKSAPDGPEMPGFGVARDIRRLKTHGAASVAELREFLGQMRGRSPQQVLGMVAGSHLMRSVGWAAIGVAIILVVGTLLPWWMGGPPNGNKSAAKASAAPKAAVAAPAQAKSEKPIAAQPAPQAPAPVAKAETKPSPADAEKAVKVMGLGDTKTADPKANPMEKSLDNLLDKLE